MTEEDKYTIGARLLPVLTCSSSFLLSDGAVYSRRGSKQSRAWTQECQGVCSFLNIGPEQHPATGATEYVVKPVVKPHLGLLGERMFYWLVFDMVPAAGRMTGTLVATIYAEPADPDAYQFPITLYLKGFDASFVAYAALDAEKDPPQGAARQAAWAKKAASLLEKWKRAEVLPAFHQITTITT